MGTGNLKQLCARVPLEDTSGAELKISAASGSRSAVDAMNEHIPFPAWCSLHKRSMTSFVTLLALRSVFHG